MVGQVAGDSVFEVLGKVTERVVVSLKVSARQQGVRPPTPECRPVHTLNPWMKQSSNMRFIVIEGKFGGLQPRKRVVSPWFTVERPLSYRPVTATPDGSPAPRLSLRRPVPPPPSDASFHTSW